MLYGYLLDQARDEFFNILTRIKVPKVQLYYDLKVKCSDEFLGQRNAKVLKRKCLISQDTGFYKKLQTFRAERDKKILLGIHSTQLFLPGKIIHLVDTRGNNSSSGYVPYYARRHEFNQVVFSSRMISDHDIHYLVEIFENTRLCGDFKTISCAFTSTQYIMDEEDPDVDDRLFICCSNPYGKLPVLMSVLVTIAFGLALSSHLGCRMFITSLPDLPIPIEGNGSLRVSYGLYLYSIVDCVSGICNSLDEYEKVGKCLPYPTLYIEGGSMLIAQIFSFLTELVGFVALAIITVSHCFAITRRWWRVVTCLLLLSTFFQGLVLLPVRSCEYAMEERLSDNCQIAQNAVGCIVACCLWFICAVSSLSIARFEQKQ